MLNMLRTGFILNQVNINQKHFPQLMQLHLKTYSPQQKKKFGFHFRFLSIKR